MLTSAEASAVDEFRQTSATESRIRKGIGAALLLVSWAHVAAVGTDAAAVVPTLGSAAGLMLMLQGLQSS